MTRYEHQGGAKATTLSSGITSGASTITIADGTGWPTGADGPFWFAMDRDSSAEEKCTATGRTGNTLTGVTRGLDGTSAASHQTNAPVEHVISATEVDKFDAHVEDTTRDDHTQYLTEARGNAAYAAAGVEAFAAYMPTSLSVPNGTWTQVTATTEVFDEGADYDAASATYTVPETYTYRITAAGRYNSSTTGMRWLTVWLGAVGTGTRLAETLTPGASALHSLHPISTYLELTAGQEIRLGTYQDSGAALNMAGGDLATRWAIEKVK